MTLGEIKRILELQHAGTAPCARVTQLLDAHIAEIDRPLSDLAQLRATLLTVRRDARHIPKSGFMDNQMTTQVPMRMLIHLITHWGVVCLSS